MIQVILDSPCTFNYISLFTVKKVESDKKMECLFPGWPVLLNFAFLGNILLWTLIPYMNGVYFRDILYLKKKCSALPSTAILLQWFLFSESSIQMLYTVRILNINM